ncbi:NUDIX domain-containing protein [Vibrio sp. TRT 17S01]|uniref:NUDIX domain-containing protein n=1 Tax=Vibrio sp. TRT 17S01 TaxID=3418505 RepID=UPI003CF08B4C
MMQHRIRAAGILIENNKILLLKVRDFSGEYWIPPGGGFEATDISTKRCLQREFKEETGLEIDVGSLIAVREFHEMTLERFNAEFFYHVESYQGEITLSNLSGMNDEEFIQCIEWVDLNQLSGLRTFPSDMLFIVNQVMSHQFSEHLGCYIQGAQEKVNQL